MRKRSNVLVQSLLLIVPLVSNSGAALADASEASADTAQTVEGDAQDVAKSERMRALSEVRFGKGTDMFSLPPAGINTLADALVFRPVNAGLGVLSAVTYVIAVGPTLAFEPDRHDELVNSLLVEPWLLIWKRPFGSPLDYRASEPSATRETRETSETSAS